jgi:hypothetical protein
MRITLISELEIEMEVEVSPVPVIEKGRWIGWVRELPLQTVLLGERVTGPRSRLHTVI